MINLKLITALLMTVAFLITFTGAVFSNVSFATAYFAFTGMFFSWLCV